MGGERCPEGPGNEADCTEGRNEVEEPGTGLQAAGTGLEEADDRTRCCGGGVVDQFEDSTQSALRNMHGHEENNVGIAKLLRPPAGVDCAYSLVLRARFVPLASRATSPDGGPASTRSAFRTGGLCARMCVLRLGNTYELQMD